MKITSSTIYIDLPFGKKEINHNGTLSVSSAKSIADKYIKKGLKVQLRHFARNKIGDYLIINSINLS